MSAYDSDPRVKRLADCFEVAGPGGTHEVVWLGAAWVAVDPATAAAESKADFDTRVAALPRHASADEAIASVIGDPR